MSDTRVVVTGLGSVTPLGLTADSTWAGLMNGSSGIRKITSFDAEAFETRIAAEILDFDPLNYMDRKLAHRTDRFAQFAMAAAQEATHQAGLIIDPTIAERTSVIIGSGVGGILTLSREYDVLHDRGPSRISPFLVPMMLIDMAGAQVSIMLGAQGPSFSTVTACATGSDAIGEGFELIKRGEIDVAVAGGAEAPICPIAIGGFNSCGALSRKNDSPESASRPFDSDRDGFILGEGSAVIVLEEMNHALRRGAQPLAELVGYGATTDASHITQPAPFGQGGARAMKLAMKKANVDPEEIGYLNAHGTSTPVNDKAETEAIKSAFGEKAYRIPISSTKSMTGHLLGTAGAAEALICVQTIQYGRIPPTINLTNPDPECDLDYTPLNPINRQVDVAMTNSLGFGGHNSTLIFRRYES